MTNPNLPTKEGDAILINAANSKINFPLNFNREVRNLVDHNLIIEVEAQSTKDVDLRMILNINSLDSSVSFSAGSRFEVHKFTVPVIKLRETNPLRMLLTSAAQDAVFKLRRITFSLDNNL